jgi:hypothetical protein
MGTTGSGDGGGGNSTIARGLGGGGGGGGGALRLRAKLPTARNETDKEAATVVVVLVDDQVSDRFDSCAAAVTAVTDTVGLTLLLLFTASAAKLLGVDAVAVELEETAVCALGW